MFDNINELIYDLVDEKYIDRNLTGYYDAQKHYHDMGPIGGVKAAVKQISSDLSMMKDNKAKDSAKTLAKLASSRLEKPKDILQLSRLKSVSS